MSKEIVEVIALQTEGDVEGKSIRMVGYFIGTLSQVITHCILNNIKPFTILKLIL